MSRTLSAPTSTASADRVTRGLIDRLFPRPRNFDVRLHDGTVLPGAESPRFSLNLRHPGALRRMFSPPIELSLGESYIYGDFDIQGDIFSVLSLLDSSRASTFSPSELVSLWRSLRALPASGPERPAGRGEARLRGRIHSRERDLAAVRYHYDVGNQFFALWLDRRLQYSCAYFPTGAEDLDTAQEAKLEHICRKLRLQPGERLLDIGCGWAGLAEYAAENYDVTVVGITLSAKQAEFAQRIRDGRVTVEMRDYRDLAGGSFDKIVSVGMFEHVGRSELPTYFACAYDALKPGGLFLNHGISNLPVDFRSGDGWRQRLKRRITGEGYFAQRYVFPDGQLVTVSEANAIAERVGFEVRDVENLREHYPLTLRHWVNRLDSRRDEAVAATDEVTYRTWRLYMAAVAYGFEDGRLSVNQSLLAKPDSGKVGVPLTRAAFYSDSTQG